MAIEHKTLKVVGERKMHCSGCESSVKFALQELSGVQGVEASHKTQLINLTLEAEASDLAQIRQELDWLGYQVAEVKEA
jgi:copper chaperone